MIRELAEELRALRAQNWREEAAFGGGTPPDLPLKLVTSDIRLTQWASMIPAAGSMVAGPESSAVAASFEHLSAGRLSKSQTSRWTP